MKRILLPVDGSETNNKSIETAKNMALKFDSEIIILVVKAPAEHKSHDLEMTHADYHEEHYRAASERILKSTLAKLDGTGINVTSKVEDGHAASGIIDFAENENIDLIVIATHGKSALKKHSLGSVAHKVVIHATVPVLLVR